MAENDEKKPQPTLASRLSTIGAVLGGLLGTFVVGPQLFPKEPGQSFSLPQVGVAGACAVVGGMVLFGLGTLMGPKGKK